MRLGVLACATIMFACRSQGPLYPSDADAAVFAPTDAEPSPSPDGDTPSRACANLRALGCVEGFGVPGGVSCEDAMRSAPALDFRSECLAAAPTRQAAAACCPDNAGCSPSCR